MVALLFLSIKIAPLFALQKLHPFLFKNCTAFLFFAGVRLRNKEVKNEAF
jgi:hypothetical protein